MGLCGVGRSTVQRGRARWSGRSSGSSSSAGRKKGRRSRGADGWDRAGSETEGERASEAAGSEERKGGALSARTSERGLELTDEWAQAAGRKRVRAAVASTGRRTWVGFGGVEFGLEGKERELGRRWGLGRFGLVWVFYFLSFLFFFQTNSN